MNAGLITQIVLAVAAVVAALTPLWLSRRKSRQLKAEEEQRKLEAAKKSGEDSAAITLAGWTALNKALQDEVNRLQISHDRLQRDHDKLQESYNRLQAGHETLQAEFEIQRSEISTLRARLAIYEAAGHTETDSA